MQTAQLKYDIISWATGLNDKAKEVSPPKNRNLTKGYGLWADDAPFDETNYRDKIGQQERNVW